MNSFSIRKLLPRVFQQHRKMEQFKSDFNRFTEMSTHHSVTPPVWSERYPCLDDNTQTTSFDAHYIYHPAWAARIIQSYRPENHVDISSTLTFCSVISAFIPVEFYDYRPANLHLSNLSSHAADLTSLHFESNSILSMSCMHTVEHIGLGRYGDPIDPGADQTAMKELMRVLAPAGNFLFVVPIGRPKIAFNAHRIYSFRQICDHFSDLTLKSFALLPDDYSLGLIENATEAEADAQSYACGCFWFEKPL